VGRETAAHSRKVLLHYGQGSIKKSGLYDRVCRSLREAGVQFSELPGVVPNPRLGLVRQGIELCRREKIGLILAFIILVRSGEFMVSSMVSPFAVDRGIKQHYGWIAGGIGLTPFLSFIRDMDGTLKHDVDFYYTVRHPEEALFLNEIDAADQKNPRLRTHIRFSATQGSLNVEEIVKNAGGDLRDYDIYLCGPLPMIQAFTKKFLELGVPGSNIHYEEFNFR